MTQLRLDGPTGFIVEGPSDVEALRTLLQKINVDCARPVPFHGQPVEVELYTFLRKRIIPTARALIAAKTLARLIVIFDRELRSRSAASLAADAQNFLSRELGAAPPVHVAVSDRAFENWIIADPVRVRSHKLISRDFETRVGQMADGLDGLAILKWAFARNAYVKARHARQLAELVDVTDEAVVARSPSLRSLLKACGTRQSGSSAESARRDRR